MSGVTCDAAAHLELNYRDSGVVYFAAAVTRWW